jgi:hypothetical protein
MGLMSGRPHKTPRIYHGVDENAFLQYRQLIQRRGCKRTKSKHEKYEFYYEYEICLVWNRSSSTMDEGYAEACAPSGGAVLYIAT